MSVIDHEEYIEAIKGEKQYIVLVNMIMQGTKLSCDRKSLVFDYGTETNILAFLRAAHECAYNLRFEKLIAEEESHE